jgi:type I restriction enzyme S subunit
MSAVDERRGVIERPEVRMFEDVQRGFTYFEEGDVLFAKITPCMQNGKHAIARTLIDGVGFASTEFHVIRPTREILAEWVHYFLRQPSTLAEAEHHFTGTAGQQRVPPDFLERLEIPLPPLEEQKRIVAILNEQMCAVERARLAAEAGLEAAKVLPSVPSRK